MRMIVVALMDLLSNWWGRGRILAEFFQVQAAELKVPT